ncbi:hypothetical protein [Micromonospora sp. NPDC047738]|uniref:hypothetical protein n=1 Tax=unclassified Micromonospora TaxID=2617518 RepID=UPI00341028A7
MRTAPAVTTGPWVRLLLLLCTLVGLTAMHTLGHGTHAPGGPGDHAAADHAAPPAAAAGHGAPPAAVAGPVTLPAAVAGMAGDCPGDGCGPARMLQLTDAQARLLPLGDPGGDRPGWSICLAVLGAFAVTLLVALLLRAGSRTYGPAARVALRAAPGPRAPPPRPYGLRLATVSVLRR